MKPGVKTLRYLVNAVQIAQKTNDLRERQVALALEIELTERLAALEKKTATAESAEPEPAHAA